MIKFYAFVLFFFVHLSQYLVVSEDMNDIVEKPDFSENIMHKIFQHADNDIDGIINHREFNVLIEDIRKQFNLVGRLNDKEIQNLLEELDENNDGDINYEEFRVFIIVILEAFVSKSLK